MESSPIETSYNNLGEERIDERDESRKILSPRNLNEVSRPQVSRNPPFSNITEE
jgi:hypothetical protein